MEKHFHTDLTFVVMSGVSAVIVINAIRLGAATMANKPGIIGILAKGLGATVHFGS